VSSWSSWYQSSVILLVDPLAPLLGNYLERPIMQFSLPWHNSSNHFLVDPHLYVCLRRRGSHQSLLMGNSMWWVATQNRPQPLIYLENSWCHQWEACQTRVTPKPIFQIHGIANSIYKLLVAGLAVPKWRIWIIQYQWGLTLPHLFMTLLLKCVIESLKWI